MLPKGVWSCAVPTLSLPFLLLQDPAQKQTQVDPRWDIFQAEHAGGAVSFQPSPALTPSLPQAGAVLGAGVGALLGTPLCPLPRAPRCSATSGARLGALNHFSNTALLRTATCRPTD